MKNIKLWPHATLIALGCALVGALAVGLYSKYGTNSEAEALPNAARIQRVDGEVALSDGLSDDTNRPWTAAEPNQSFSVGDRIYTRDNSRASLALTGRNYVRLDPNTSLDAISLTDDRTQLALREGTALFDVGYLPSGGLYEVGTPYGAVDFNEPGLYQVGIGNGNTMVSVLSGLAQVAGLGSGGRISKGEMLTLLGATAAEAVLSRLNNQDAGYLVDDYYRYQYPNYYDGRYVSYDSYLNDPYYFDPYRRNASYQYVSNAIPGVNDLDYYGDWVQANDYGYVWRPRVDTAWVPYQEGYWVNDYPYGPTWVSNEPWGYAPYHYGRWVTVNNQWVWVPDGVNTAPRYSPALVAFLPLNDNTIGWVPLGPGDPYAPRYYDNNWQPHYLTSDVNAIRLTNLGVPNAVTVVPVDALYRPIDQRVVMRVNPQTFAQVRPTLEPLMVTPLRNAALNSAWGRGKIDLPPGIAKRLRDTQVVVNNTPVAPPFRKDLARTMRLEAKNQKRNIKDERNAGPAQVNEFRRQQIEAARVEAARGNNDARQQVRELEKQQLRNEREQRIKQIKAMPPVRGEKAGNPIKATVRGEKVDHPIRQRSQPQVTVPQARPQVQAPRPRVEIPKGRREAPGRSAAPSAPPRVERQQGPPAMKYGGQPQQQQAPGQSKGGGGGKGKGKKP